MKYPARWLLALLFSCVTIVQCAAANSLNTQAQSIPTLDEWGLIGLISALGVAGGLVMRRRATRK